MTINEQREIRSEFRKWYIASNKTMEELAQDIGIFHVSLYNFMYNKRKPQLKTLWKIKDFLDRQRDTQLNKEFAKEDEIDIL